MNVTAHRASPSEAAELRKMLIEVADTGFNGTTHFKVSNVAKSYPEIHQKLLEIQKVTPCRIASQLFLLRRDGLIKPGRLRPHSIYKKEISKKNQTGEAPAPFMARPVMPPTRLDSDNYSVAVPEVESKKRIIWTPDELKTLVEKFLS